MGAAHARIHVRDAIFASNDFLLLLCRNRNIFTALLFIPSLVGRVPAFHGHVVRIMTIASRYSIRICCTCDEMAARVRINIQAERDPIAAIDD